MTVALAWLALVFPASADATTGLAWKFPESGHRYHLVARVSVPQILWFRAEKNWEFRVPVFQIDLVTTCKPVVATKSGWELRCDLDDVALQAEVIEDDYPHTQEVLDELDQRLTDAWVQLQFGANGRLKNLDLEDFPKTNERTSTIHQVMSMVVGRAFALLDLELPKKGDDKGRGAWASNGGRVTDVVTGGGTLGSVQVVHKIASQSGTVVEIQSAGDGMVSSGETISVGGQERPMFTWEIKFDSVAKFDTSLGALIERQYIVDGQSRSTSLDAGSSDGLPYVQAARLERLAEGQVVVLPATGSIRAAPEVTPPPTPPIGGP